MRNVSPFYSFLLIRVGTSVLYVSLPLCFPQPSKKPSDTSSLCSRFVLRASSLMGAPHGPQFMCYFFAQVSRLHPTFQKMFFFAPRSIPCQHEPTESSTNQPMLPIYLKWLYPNISLKMARTSWFIISQIIVFNFGKLSSKTRVKDYAGLKKYHCFRHRLSLPPPFTFFKYDHNCACTRTHFLAYFEILISSFYEVSGRHSPLLPTPDWVRFDPLGSVSP